jgi:hypothetical protein
MSKIKVIIKHPDDKVGRIVYVNNTLERFQMIVKGYIETVPLTHNSVIICNEEGKLQKLPPNFMFGDIDMICGTVIVCGVDGDDFCDVPFDLDYWEAWLNG